MKILVVLSFEIGDPNDVVQVLEKIDPQNLPFFNGLARIVVDPYATQVEQFLDSDN